MNDFMKDIILSLTEEASKRGLRTAEQIQEFATKAINVKYGENQKINIAEIVVSVFQSIHTGIAGLPDDIPDELKPPDLDSPAINAAIKEMAVEMAQGYKSEYPYPKLDQIYTDVKVKLGLTDESGLVLKLADDVSSTKLAKVTTLIGSVLSQEKTFDENADDSFSQLYNAVNNEVNPE